MHRRRHQHNRFRNALWSLSRRFHNQMPFSNDLPLPQTPPPPPAPPPSEDLLGHCTPLPMEWTPSHSQEEAPPHRYSSSSALPTLYQQLNLPPLTALTPPQQFPPHSSSSREQLDQLMRFIESRHPQLQSTTPPASSSTHARRTNQRFGNHRGARHFVNRRQLLAKSPTDPNVNSHIQPSLQQHIRRPLQRHSRQRHSLIRLLNLSQAPPVWFGSLTIARRPPNPAPEVSLPIAAFAYTLRAKPPFTASLPASIKLGSHTVRKYRQVIQSATSGGCMIRMSPVNDYGQSVINYMYSAFVSTSMANGDVHQISVDGGNVLLFPLTFPQIGLCFIGIFVAA